ncbi:Na+/H+ antiporter subunit G [Palleronia abyssalis]|uniref:Na(+)/H(+) antiporter subunit G n=1 Tax=Palleronia abyssalis TaxID=1501240 RepID=A0A2R8BT13_9RHOB|nr:Na+/H+ antiporter subunit G [Palleronia abyssalis]SPJ23270.1 Na(+)/H(+) antiporter subunit G [Palleronia abyssalis]
MIWDIVISVCLVIGAIFTFVGSIGLLKLDTPMKRVHAPTKASTLGVGSLLLASMIHAFVYEGGSLHELLIMAFLFVTAPISANFISKVNLHREDVDPTPPPPGDRTWSTFDTGPADVGEPHHID